MKTKSVKITEALERQTRYNNMTKEEKIAQAKSRRGHSKKELAKIEKAQP